MLIPAATIILLRDAPELEAIMIERHRDISFAGGALVFPGGRIDPGDRDPAWSGLCDGLSADRDRAASEVAAIREAFEETGVLLARRRGQSELLSGNVVAGLQDWRARSEADEAEFRRLIEIEGLVLACDSLALFAHWAPPKEVRHKRFDTLFFVAIAPGDQAVRQDGVEATEALWVSPKAALSAAADGARKIIFPTARNLELLALNADAAAAMAAARARTVRRIEPRVVERADGFFLTIPDDLGYPVTEEPLSAAMRS